tara:strand:+ start:5802 stop:6380 length:579 start_codon:yes stop_codon:yes gene_type:complete
MSVNFSDPSPNNPSLPDIGTEQKAPQVFHAIGQNLGDDFQYAGPNYNWKWVTGVTMTAVRPNSTYHITLSTYAVANGSNNGQGTPYVRIRRGNTNTYVTDGGSNGMSGRTSVNTNFNRNVHDGSLLNYIFKDQPGLRTGDTVTYSLQVKCNGADGYALFGYSTEGFGYDGASLVVKEIGPEIGSTVANAIGR